MNIRKATVADVPALVALNQSVQDMHAEAFPEKFRRHTPEETVAQAFLEMIQAPSSYWLVAEEEEQPVAFLSAEFRERGETWCLAPHCICYLSGIGVVPGFRRRGIARALLDELKREAAARGVTSIELDVWTFNEPARQAFARLGFRGIRETMALSESAPHQGGEHVSIADILGPWVEADWDSSLIERCRRAWNRPLRDLSREDLATFLRQRIAVEHVLPVARERVQSGVDDDTEFYEGELEAAIEDASHTAPGR